MSRALQQKIHIACRDLGISSDARHDIQLRIVGKPSMRDMSPRDFTKLLEHFKSLGWKPFKQGSNAQLKGRKKGYKPRADRRDVRLIHVLWGKLSKAGCLERPDRAGLNAFIRKSFEKSWGSVPMDVDMLRDPKQISAVIEALKSWCAREGLL